MAYDYYYNFEIRRVDYSRRGKVLGQTVVKQLNDFSLDLAYCVGIGTDGCSVMTSKQCDAVHEIQSLASNAVRCPCFNHALNLLVCKSSGVQSFINSVSVMKEVVSFFTASAKRNFVLKSVLKGQLLGICDTRWVERHDAVLQFQCSLQEIVKSLTIVSSREERDSSIKANGLYL